MAQEEIVKDEKDKQEGRFGAVSETAQNCTPCDSPPAGDGHEPAQNDSARLLRAWHTGSAVDSEKGDAAVQAVTVGRGAGVVHVVDDNELAAGVYGVQQSRC